MRSPTPIASTRSAGSKGAVVAVLVLLFTASAATPGFAQGGGVDAPDSGGVPAPDPAPAPTPAPAPDAAPGADSDSVEVTPSPGTAPAPATPPDTTLSAPQTSTAAPAASQPAEPRGNQRRARKPDKRAAQNNARDKRNARQRHRRSSVGRANPGSVFGLNLQLVAGAAGDTNAESPSVELVAWALLTLVLAAAGLLTLTARLSRMEGLTGPMPGGWLQQSLQTARLRVRGAGGRPVS